MSKWMYVIGVVLIGGFAALGMMEMHDAATPYVMTVAQAKAASGSVQFMGSIVKGKTNYLDAANELVFQLKDKGGQTLDVRFRGVKPASFDSADQAVVRGSVIGTEFVADQVLCKCPSKYQQR